MVPEVRLLDKAGAALMLGTTVRHMRHLVFERKIAYVKVGGKVRFDVRDLERFIKVNRVEGR